MVMVVREEYLHPLGASTPKQLFLIFPSRAACLSASLPDCQPASLATIHESDGGGCVDAGPVP